MSDCRTWRDAYEEPCGRCDACRANDHQERTETTGQRIEKMLEAICEHLGVELP